MAPAKRKTRAQLRQDAALVRLLRTAVEQTGDEDGWANLSTAAQYIANNNSSFSSINYGFRKISDLIKATDMFEMKRRDGAAIYLRDKRAA